MIEFRNVSKHYGQKQVALDRVDLRLQRGEFAFLTGHSGAGKSTLLKLLLRLEQPSSGEVYVGGQALSTMLARQVPYYRRHLGFVFQNAHLIPERSVFDNVAMPLIIANVDSRELQRRVHAALDKVGLLRKERAMPESLSGGEAQRVSIARAIVNRPPILLADEPTGNLDPTLSAEILNLFEAFNQVGVTVLIASHDLDLLEALGHRIIRLEHGAISGTAHGVAS
ncbi:cell division ATP-binding protein FtsE [Allohahella marinimesophila]|uniref:Cell division ATP-binding protein FtsE n=1 Tax=Allohahella marinimesophila TaxID=1054972 RepID=A0ABP7PHX1_9GAMM